MLLLRRVGLRAIRAGRPKAAKALRRLLELSPLAHHGPYVADYVRHDLRALFKGAGLQPIGAERAPHVESHDLRQALASCATPRG